MNPAITSNAPTRRSVENAPAPRASSFDAGDAWDANDDLDDILGDGWDLLAVMHPPCTRLCRSGRRWMSGPGKWTPPKKLPRGRTVEDLRAEFDDAVDLFVACWRAPIERVALENPVMNDLATDRMPADLPPGSRPERSVNKGPVSKMACGLIPRSLIWFA